MVVAYSDVFIQPSPSFVFTIWRLSVQIKWIIYKYLYIKKYVDVSSVLWQFMGG